MLDPFPIPAPSWIRPLAEPIVALTGFETLPYHLHEILLAAAFYQFVFAVISPAFSNLFFSKTYKTLPHRTRVNWDVHVVSFVQSTMIIVLAFWVMKEDTERAEMTDWRARIWGYTGATGLIAAMATGYFLWDLVMCVRYVRVFGAGLLAHAMSALCVYSFGFRPYVNYYAPNFILFELSSPFLNIHWFCDKLDLTGSTLQWANGILLLATFFGSRLVWGFYQSALVMSDIYNSVQYATTPDARHWVATLFEKFTPAALSSAHASTQVYAFKNNAGAAPLWLAGAYLGSNIVLNVLNLVWFNKMIATIRARFEPPFGTKRADVVMGRGVHDDGTKTVEVSAREVKRGSATRRKA